MATFDQALEAVVARTGHARFRDLCDPRHPDHRPAYREHVVRLYGSPVEGFPAPCDDCGEAVTVAPCGGCGESSAPEPATLGQMARSVIGAAVGFVASGGETVAEEVYRARLAICQACEHQADKWCLLCRCYLPAKTRLPDQECPIGKWVAAT